MTNNNYVQILNAFNRIEQNIASLLIKNKDIFRLLWYEDWKVNPYEMDIDDFLIEEMLNEYDERHQINKNCRVFFEPFVPEPETMQRSQIRVFPAEVRPIDIYEADVFMQVDIIVNLAVNRFKGGRRMNALASEVIKALNGQEIGLMQPLEMVRQSLRMYQFKADYWGYSFFLKTGVACNGTF